MAITIKEPSDAFMSVVDVWHGDHELNKLLGFGGGKAGERNAKLLLKALSLNEEQDKFLLALWNGKIPIGYSVLDNIDPKNRNLEIHLTIAPEHQDQGLGTESLARISEHCFNNGLVRLTFSPFAHNKRAVNMAKKVGYKVEAKIRMAAWTPDGYVDLMQMRLIKPERAKLKRYINEPTSI